MTSQLNDLVVTKPIDTRVIIPTTGIVFKQDRQEYDYAEFEAATEARVRPLLENLGVRFLCIRDVPEETILITLDGVDFRLSRATKERAFHFPEEICESLDARFAAAKEQGIMFSYFLYGEEDEPPDTFRYGHTFVYTGKVYDSWHGNAPHPDPCVIAVVKTAPKRGLWFLLEKW